MVGIIKVFEIILKIFGLKNITFLSVIQRMECSLILCGIFGVYYK